MTNFSRLYLLLAAAILSAGCIQQTESKSAPAAPEVQQVQAVSTEPGEIELSNPTVRFTPPNSIRFEVNYRFTKGKPDKYYMCEVAFPGTKNHAAKPMESWELKPEGVINDGIVVSALPVEKFEIRVSEADSPQNGYKLISNVVRGSVK